MIGTPTLIIMVIVMYTAGALVSDTILRDTELSTVKGAIAELLLASIIISLFTVFPFHLFVCHKSVLATLPIYLAFIVAYFLVCGSMLTITSYNIRHGKYFVEIWHTMNIVMLVILTLLIK